MAVKYFKTKTKAQAFVKAAREQLAGDNPGRGIKTLAHAVDKLEEALRTRGASERTISNSCAGVKLIAPVTTPLARCSASWVREKTKAMPSELSVATRRFRLKLLKQVLRQADEEGWRPYDREIDPIRIPGRAPRGKPTLTADEVQRFAEEAERYEPRVWGTYALLQLSMACRPNDLLKRVVRDVDRGGTVLLFTGSKTPGGDGPASIPVWLQPRVQELVEGQSPDAPLFRRRDGRGYEKTAEACRHVKRICEAAGTIVITAQALRHTGLTLRRAVGNPLEDIRELARHASASITSRHYVDPTVEREAQRHEIQSVIAPKHGASSD